jgi:hypothetical protein
MPPKNLTVGLVQPACSADRAANLAASIHDLANRVT